MAIVLDGTSGITTNSGTLLSTNDATISGLTVGKGGGSEAGSTTVGSSSLGGASTNTGTDNSAFGFGTLYVNTSGSSNSAFGRGAMRYNTTGGSNSSFGYQALNNNTTASNNTAVGYQAGYTNSTNQYGTFIGSQAGYSSTGDFNTFVGYYAGRSTTGEQNTFIGKYAGNAITTGTLNTIIGAYNGNQGGLDIRTASNYIVLSDGGGNPRAWIGAGNNNDLFRVGTVSTSTSNWMHQISYNQTSRAVLGITNDVSGGNPSGITINYPNSSDTSSTNNYLYCSNSAGARAYIKNDGGFSNYQANNGNLSDQREKKNIELAPNYLDKICQIPVKTFLFNDQEDTELNLGAIAQDVQAICPELVVESNWAERGQPEKLRLSIYQTDLQYALMKSIQELKALVDAQATEIAELKAKVA